MNTLGHNNRNIKKEISNNLDPFSKINFENLHLKIKSFTSEINCMYNVIQTNLHSIYSKSNLNTEEIDLTNKKIKENMKRIYQNFIKITENNFYKLQRLELLGNQLKVKLKEETIKSLDIEANKEKYLDKIKNHQEEKEELNLVLRKLIQSNNDQRQDLNLLCKEIEFYDIENPELVKKTASINKETRETLNSKEAVKSQIEETIKINENLVNLIKDMEKSLKNLTNKQTFEDFKFKKVNQIKNEIKESLNKIDKARIEISLEIEKFQINSTLKDLKDNDVNILSQSCFDIKVLISNKTNNIIAYLNDLNSIIEIRKRSVTKEIEKTLNLKEAITSLANLFFSSRCKKTINIIKGIFKPKKSYLNNQTYYYNEAQNSLTSINTFISFENYDQNKSKLITVIGKFRNEKYLKEYQQKKEYLENLQTKYDEEYITLENHKLELEDEEKDIKTKENKIKNFEDKINLKVEAYDKFKILRKVLKAFSHYISHIKAQKLAKIEIEKSNKVKSKKANVHVINDSDEESQKKLPSNHNPEKQENNFISYTYKEETNEKAENIKKGLTPKNFKTPFNEINLNDICSDRSTKRIKNNNVVEFDTRSTYIKREPAKSILKLDKTPDKKKNVSFIDELITDAKLDEKEEEIFQELGCSTTVTKRKKKPIKTIKEKSFGYTDLFSSNQIDKSENKDLSQNYFSFVNLNSLFDDGKKKENKKLTHLKNKYK